MYPTHGRRSRLNVFLRAHCGPDSEPLRMHLPDPTRTKGRFRCCALGSLCGRLVLVSTAPENRHWISWFRFSGGLGECPRIERVPWRQSRRSAKVGFHRRQTNCSVGLHCENARRQETITSCGSCGPAKTFLSAEVALYLTSLDQSDPAAGCGRLANRSGKNIDASKRGLSLCESIH